MTEEVRKMIQEQRDDLQHNKEMYSFYMDRQTTQKKEYAKNYSEDLVENIKATRASLNLYISFIKENKKVIKRLQRAYA